MLATAFGACLGASSLASDSAANDVEAARLWQAYALDVARVLQHKLGSPDDVEATRLHRYLQDLSDAGTPLEERTIFRIWISDAARIVKVSFGTLGSAEADRDLRVLLTGSKLPGAPPADMPQPIILKLGLASKG